jgi:menaquinone-dependent protoporphyrinogen oxidase
MENKTLLAWASKYGSTTEIAERIGQVLRAAGLTVDVLPVEEAQDLTPYHAVILGSAVYAGQWRRDAVSFLEDNEIALSQRPVWFFSSGPTGEGDAVSLMRGWYFPEAQKPLADRIKPRDIAFFHGELDMNKLNFGEKILIKGLKAPVGDFRDWAAIEAWANQIAEALKTEAAHPAP